MKNTALFLFSLFLFSCNNEMSSGKQPASVPLKTAKLSDQELLLKKIKTLDTLTPAGNSLRYSLDSSRKIVVTVSNKHFQKSFKSSQFTEPGLYVYNNEWKEYVGLRNKCGSTCWTLAVLPLTKKGRVANYDYDIAADSQTNRLFCKKHLEGNDYYVLNIETKKRKLITLSGLAGNGFIGSGIDSVAFVKGGLFVKWEIAGAGKKGKTKTEIFKLTM
jgi:hypothetical protein